MYMCTFQVMDLLEPKESDLPIREDTDKNILIPGLAEKEIKNFDEFKAYFGPASNNRYSIPSVCFNNMVYKVLPSGFC